MRSLFFLCMFIILGMQVAGAQSITTIEIQKNGDANWTVEKHIPFITNAEINEWDGFLRNGTHLVRYKKDIEDFNRMLNQSLRAARNYSNRSMKIENFNISYDTVRTLPNAFGIIRVKFIWKNFSRIEDDKILVGDTFSEGRGLSSENVLIIKIPEGYKLDSAIPNYDKKDGNRLIWDGTLYYNLDKGEPALVLSPNMTGIPAAEANERPLTDAVLIALKGTDPIIIAGSILLALGIVTYLLRSRKKRGEIPLETISNKQIPLPDLTEEDLRDEEMIEQILMRAGGQAYQSNIVKESGFSKSKISILLAQMKEEGRIIKIRKGKENLIRLVTEASSKS